VRLRFREISFGLCQEDQRWNRYSIYKADCGETLRVREKTFLYNNMVLIDLDKVYDSSKRGTVQLTLSRKGLSGVYKIQFSSLINVIITHKVITHLSYIQGVIE